jgi:subtilisin family serine protease
MAMLVPRPVLPILTGLLAALAFVPASASAGGPIYRAAQAASDPQVGDAWYLDGDGPIGIESAWDQTTGGDTIVAVVDTGVDMTHPELRQNLWTNPGEVAGNGVDDDHDGYVDDVHGADLVNKDGDPTDDNGHGTHVAGIIGARGGNGIGAAGIAWRVRIMPVKVLDAGASGDAGTVATGIRYAIAHGARIVNLSLSGPGRSDALESAIAAARDAGVLVVCAAGNDGRDLGSTPAYPASYPEENLISVAATSSNGRLASISNYGAGVELAAPGDTIFSTARGGGYELRTGTSMASPMVAGTAALVASVRPDADWRVLRGAILAGARPSNLPVANGTLDVAGALHQVISGDVWRAPATAPSSSAPSSPGTGSGGHTSAKKTKKAIKKKAKKKAHKASHKRAAHKRKTHRKHGRSTRAVRVHGHAAWHLPRA